MTAAQCNQSERIPTAERVAFLRNPATYPDGVPTVEVRETRMSWVFLAGERVYKLKKPIRDEWLDFATVAARERNAREEVRLNRRLAASVYLGTARLTVEANGDLALDGRGDTIDWLVVMRRLPAERMLDHLITTDGLQRVEIDHVAEVLADFYRRLEPIDRPVDAHINYFMNQQAINRAVLADPRTGLDPTVVNPVLQALDAFLAGETEQLAERVRHGHIREGHGDLRAEHVCLEDPPVIIDCLEFNRELRLVDPLDELSDLGLECTRLGAPWIGDVLLERYANSLDATPPPRLLAFYTASRACLRARLAVRHLLEPGGRTPDKWLPLARAYLAAAEPACLILKAPPADRPATRSGGNGGSPPRTVGPH